VNRCLIASLPALLLVGVVLQAQQQETLGAVKQKYLNQRVVVSGYVTAAFSGRAQDILMDWHPAKEQAGGYRFNISDNLPASYKGQPATVVAIMLDKTTGRQPSEKVNALGEIVGPDQMVNPYFDLIVKFDDGKMALTTGYPITISHQVELAVAHQADSQEMSANLLAVVGRSFFATGYSRLYDPDSTLEEMRGSSEILKRMSIAVVPLLEPLQLTAAKYIDTDKVVILKLRLPNGGAAMCLASAGVMSNLQGTFLENLSVASGLLSALPTDLSAREIEVVKQRGLLHGMSRKALELSQGYAKKENDWGRGGKQLIYSDSFLVYLDNNDAVVDWHILNN